MRSWKSYSIAAVFFALSATSVAGCDVRGIIESAVLSITTGNNQGCAGCFIGCAEDCGSCGSCGSCGDCGSCGSCGDCGCGSCDCSIEQIRDRTTGRLEGFNGRGAGSPTVAQLRGRTLHNGRRISNAIQARLTQSGLTFVQNLVPVVANGIAGRIDLPASLNANTTSPGYLTVSLEDVRFVSEPSCSGNAQNGLGPNHPCLRLDTNARFRTCQPDPAGDPVCTSAETVTVKMNVAVLGDVTCHLNLNSAGAGGASQTLPVTARVALMSDSSSTSYAGYSRIKVLDAQTSSAPIDRQDVSVTCDDVKVGLIWMSADSALAANCFFRPSQPCSVNEAVDDAVTDLNNDFNTMIDALLDHYMPPFCAPASAPLDCPTGTVYAASATAGQPGKCLLAPGSAACPTGTVYHAGDNRCYNVHFGGDVNDTNDRWGTACLELFAGTEMRVNTGSVLGAISPGMESVLDFMVAAAGNGEHSNSGHNVNLAGGVEHIIAGIRALPHNPCAPIEHPANDQTECDAIGTGLEYEPMINGAFSGRCIPRVPILPPVSALRQNTAPIVDGLDGDFEIAVGVSSEFVNYAAWRVWDSGLTCLNVGSWLDPAMQPSLIAFALLAKDSQPRIFFPLNTDPLSGGGPDTVNRASLALSLHPQTAPVLDLDQVDDPCEPGADTRLEVSAAMDDLNIDLSMWSDERYSRVGTIVTDLNAVLAIDVGPQAAGNGCKELKAGDVSISLAKLTFGSAHWAPDAPMLTPADFTVGSSGMLPIQSGLNTIGGIAGGIAGGLLPSLNAEDIANDLVAGLGSSFGGSALPMHVEFHKDSFQLLEQTGPCSGAPYDSGVYNQGTCVHPYFGMFIDLAAGAPTPLTGIVDTQVQITNVTVPPAHEGFDMHGDFGTGESPTVEIAMSATGPENVEYEYAYRTSYTGWSEWQRSPYAVISGDGVRVQGHHEVFARARVAGDVSSEDQESARAPFTIDVTAPMIQVYDRPDGAELQALDLVSESLSYRVQEPGEDFGDWTALPASGITNLDVADGSVFEVRDESENVASTAESLQGRPNQATASGCGCSTAGSRESGSPLALLSAAAMAAIVATRRRRRG